MFASDDEKWRAVTMRDDRADGAFVYAVRTTRIYCRPNCKARLARRANVLFYLDCGAAEASGFRACKRCKPRTQGRMPADESVARIRELVASDRAAAGDDSHCKVNESPSLLASQARVSKWHFHRKFKEVVGQTPREYLKQRERERREAAAAPVISNPKEVCIASSKVAERPTTTTESELFAVALGEDAMFWDLTRLLAGTGDASAAMAEQPPPTFDDLFTADLTGYSFDGDGLDSEFLDTALWAEAGQSTDGWQLGLSAGEGEPVVTTGYNPFGTGG
ncbi:hypothetical protein SEPCBS57363_002567 [Sporothrix epigloea]|uniref:HTH araC/xylS-type domain-containing protein n=1 Tax=Sporothrix epigloea TaxID=1892477 RepID=A0ABP0DHW8_9PEZI